MHTKLIFIDTETTGLKPWKFSKQHHEIIEVAALQLDDRLMIQTVLHKKYHMRRPGYADAQALKINGYDAQEWKEYAHHMTYEEVAELHQLLSQDCVVIVGHNISFDIRFFRALFLEHGYEWRAPPTIDTRALARLVWKLPCLKMDTIRRHNGWRLKNSHTAMKDALDCYRIYTAFLSALQRTEATEGAPEANAV